MPAASKPVSSAPLRTGAGAGLVPPVAAVPSHWCSVASPVKWKVRTSVVTAPSKRVLVGPSTRTLTVTGAADAIGATASRLIPALRPRRVFFM